MKVESTAGADWSRPGRIAARLARHLEVSLAELTMRIPVDSHGVALWRPVEREVLPYDCAQCALVNTCKRLPTATGTALLGIQHHH